MEARFGEAYGRYREATWMFLPGEPGETVFSALFGAASRRGWALSALYVGVLVLGTALAFGVRAYSISRVPMVRYSEGLSAVSLSPAGGAAIERTLGTAMDHPEVRALLAKAHSKPGHTLVAYLVPTAYMMQHLIADLGEHEAHHGERPDAGAGAVLRHLGEMYTLKPLRQLRDGAGSPERRIIFTEALTATGASVSASRALDTDVLRFPLFFAELEGDEIRVVMETPRRHSWGTIPVPAF